MKAYNWWCKAFTLWQANIGNHTLRLRYNTPVNGINPTNGPKCSSRGGFDYTTVSLCPVKRAATLMVQLTLPQHLWASYPHIRNKHAATSWNYNKCGYFLQRIRKVRNRDVIILHSSGKHELIFEQMELFSKNSPESYGTRHGEFIVRFSIPDC